MFPGKVLLGGLHVQLEIAVGDEPFQYFLVHYLPTELESAEAKLISKISYLTCPIDGMTLQLQEQCAEVAASPGVMGKLEKKAIFFRLICHVLQSERVLQNRESATKMDDAIQFIKQHYMEPLTLTQLGLRYGMKAKYFSYLFAKYVGISPIDYVIMQRMDKAYEWLLTGRVSVAEAAKHVGYADSYYFSRLFKKHKGLPPSKVGMNGKRNRPS